jgi:glycosyltransferase involved in cell wall biosynthesis
MEISIVIPTKRRPEFLRSALLSIQKQTRIDIVREVIVSENGDATESRNVCNEFPTLPIRHINQKKVLPPTQHFRALAAASQSQWVAWIGDDDMWGRFHLEEAFRILSLHPEALSYLAECAPVRNEARRIFTSYTPILHSLGGPAAREFTDHWLWQAKDMCPETLVMTPLNIWSLVARRDVLLQASTCWIDHGGGLDADRLFLWKLACISPVAVNREVTLFYRVHEQADSQTLYKTNRSFYDKMSANYTRMIIRESEDLGLNPRELWSEAWTALNDWGKQRVMQACSKVAGAELRRIWGKDSFPDPNRRDSYAIARAAIKNICPPVLWALGRKLKSLKMK